MSSALLSRTARPSVRALGNRDFAMHAPSQASRTANLGVQAALATVLVVSSSYLYAHPASTPFDHAPRSGMMHCPARSFRAVASSSPLSSSSPSLSNSATSLRTPNGRVVANAGSVQQWELRAAGMIGKFGGY